MGDKAQSLTTNRPALFCYRAENAGRLQETDRSPEIKASPVSRERSN